MVDSNGETVTLARKSYEHLLRSRDRALREAEYEVERRQATERWAHEAFDTERRLADRLNEVCMAAAGLGVPIQAINEAIAKGNVHRG